MLQPFAMIRQSVEVKEVEDVLESAREELRQLKIEEDLEGKKIAITAGSRGLYQYPKILQLLGEFIRERGGRPYLIPSMGSQGGGKLEGQLMILKGLGITEELVNIPILPTVESVLLGEREGIPIYCNKGYLTMDGIVLLNRIKPHTDYTASIESGICKMMAIGMGSYLGAKTIHAYAFAHGYEKAILSAFELMLDRLPVLFGLGVLENYRGRTSVVKAMLPEEIVDVEKGLLVEAKNETVKLPFDDLDVLVIGEMGKNISGTGIDTKVVGRFIERGELIPMKPDIQRIVVLSMTRESEGNATGIGTADIITKELFEDIDIEDTSLNCITSMTPEQGRIPCVVENDREAIAAAIETLGFVDERAIRLVYIKNTSFLETMYVSQSLLREVEEDPRLSVIGPPQALDFDKEGSLLSWDFHK